MLPALDHQGHHHSLISSRPSSGCQPHSVTQGTTCQQAMNGHRHDACFTMLAQGPYTHPTPHTSLYCPQSIVGMVSKASRGRTLCYGRQFPLKKGSHPFVCNPCVQHQGATAANHTAPIGSELLLQHICCCSLCGCVKHEAS